jgi:hypothetical protein
MEHCGLYFSKANITQAQKYAKRDPFKSAWELLRGNPPTTPLALTQWHGLRYRFDSDQRAGEQAVHDLRGSPPSEHDLSYLDTVMTTLTLAQCIELVRDHPAFSAVQRRQSQEMLAAQVEALNTVEDLHPVERIWLALLNLAAGIVLEDDTMTTDAAQVYRGVVDHGIHPQGFIRQAVEGQKDGGSLLRMLLAVKGLVLMAEAAKHIGADLWGYTNRGVSVVTAALYPLYYYYYPEKWQWDSDIDVEEAQRLFRTHGSYLEPLNAHIGRPTRAIDLILKEIRPVYDIWGGGLLTLSHGVPMRRGIFG